MYLGGFEEAEAGVRDGVYSHNDFKVLTRYSGWGPGQLDNECRCTPKSTPRCMCRRKAHGAP